MDNDVLFFTALQLQRDLTASRLSFNPVEKNEIVVVNGMLCFLLEFLRNKMSYKNDNTHFISAQTISKMYRLIHILDFIMDMILSYITNPESKVRQYTFWWTRSV